MTRATQSAHILVLDGDMLPALAVARSLDRAGYRVTAASASASPITAHSRAIARHLRYPDPLLDRDGFLDWLDDHLQRNSHDLVIPVTERSLLPLSEQSRRFATQRIAMADPASLAVALDKSRTFALASTLDIPVPLGIEVQSLEQLDSLAEQLRFPVVVKPTHSVATDGSGYSRHAVSYAMDTDNLYRQCRANLQHSPVILQEYFDGIGMGVELIADRGELAYAFQHQRLHEVPLSGGGSSFRKSVGLDPQLLDAAARLMRAAQWHGVAMVEFKWQPSSGDFRLMEINGRLWGSLPLAVAAGADFPAMLAELFLEGAVRPRPAYRQGIYCRNFSRDLYWHELVLRSRGDEINKVPAPGAVLHDLALTVLPHHHFDAQQLADPLPGLIEIHRCLSSYMKRIFQWCSESYFTVLQRLRWRNGTVREKLREADSLLIMCYGNINRSALAEVLMASAGLSRGRRLISAGFHDVPDRPADPRMIATAASRGYTLDGHRSKRLSTEMLRNSDLVFVMEKAHFDRLYRIDPSSKSKIVLLGAYPGGPGEIPDPYNAPGAVYTKCFDTIKAAVDCLAGES